MKNYKLFLIAFLIGITIFSVFQYAASLKEKLDLKNDLSQIKKQVMDLELEKQNLLQAVEQEKEAQKALGQENSELKESLKVNTDKLAKLDADFQGAQNTIEQLNSKIALVKAENMALRAKREKLALELSSVSQEKDALKARLSSVAELKKVIKELKKQVRKSTGELKEIAAAQRIIEGNRGFLIKDGKPTYPAKVKIEVIPASTANERDIYPNK